MILMMVTTLMYYDCFTAVSIVLYLLEFIAIWFMNTITYWGRDVVVRASSWLWVYLASIPASSYTKKTKKNAIHSFLAWRLAQKKFGDEAVKFA